MVEQWNAGQIPQMIVLPLAQMHGLNLQYGGNHLIWFNPIWSLELTEQLEARIGAIRQAQAGLNRPSFYYRILDDSGTEMRVIKRIQELSDFKEASHNYFRYIE
jgi:SNF2 family DNA or RNA helicase